jgi:hypothetical protein
LSTVPPQGPRPGQQYGPQHGQQQYGPPPGWQPPRPKKQLYKRPLFWVLVGLPLLLFAGCTAAVLGAASNIDTTTPNEPAAEEPAEETTAEESADGPTATAGLNDPVRDGKFEFTVTKVDCSRTELGDEFTREQAQGKFCVVTTKVKNIGNEAQPLSASDQYAYDSVGRRYSSSDQLWTLVAANSPVYEDINPGNSRTAQLVFDVPKNTKLTRLELHDSAFSGGVQVNL